MPDETVSPFPDEPVTPPTNPTTQTKTETKTETIETDSGVGKLRRHPGELLGMSGRFWVTMVALIGSTYVVVLSINSQDMGTDTKAVIIGAYIAMASGVASNYLGQNAGPTKPKPS